MRALLIVPLLVAPAVAQQPTTRTLTKPDAEYSEPFTQLTGFRELRDGRVLASDQRDKTVQAINLKSGSAVAIGREGSGPMEWSLPGRFVGMPGDTTLMSDSFNSRFLVIGPDGKAVRTLSPVVDGSTGSTGGTREQQPNHRLLAHPRPRGGNAWESNPPNPTKSGRISFED